MSRILRRRTLIVPVCAAVLGGSLVGFAAGSEVDHREPLVAAAELRRTPLPQGDPARGRAGVERTALQLAATLDAVPVRADGDEGTRYCAPERLEVRWEAPLPGEYAAGGHLEPVGPAPSETTESVNGIVVCAGASYAYMGFEARWSGTRWDVASVPALSDEHDLHEAQGVADDDEHEGDAADPHEAHEARGHREQTPDREHVHPPQRKAAAAASGRRATAATGRGFTVPPAKGIDPYAAYDPQRVCDPVAKPGTLALRNLLLRTYPVSRSLGISRTCTARGVSEHKEGRAFDWGVDIGVPAERAAAETVLAQLLATDAAGHRHALARRLGVMYVIWNRQIWSAYSADRGWRPYSGANAHTDHVHLSLSWAGAMGRTSYWTGANAPLLEVDPELQLIGGGTPPRSGGTAGGSGDDHEREDDAVARRKEDDAREPRAGRTRRVRDDDADETQQDPDDDRQWPRTKGKGRKHRDDDPLVTTALADTDAERQATSVDGGVPRDAERLHDRAQAVDAEGASTRHAEPERAKAEQRKAARAKAERAKAEQRKAERAQTQRTKAERRKAERAKAEQRKAERAQTQRAKAERRKAERAKAERAKAKRTKVQRGSKATRAKSGRTDARSAAGADRGRSRD